MTQDRVVEGPQIERVAKAGSRLLHSTVDHFHRATAALKDEHQQLAGVVGEVRG